MSQKLLGRNKYVHETLLKQKSVEGLKRKGNKKYRSKLKIEITYLGQQM